VKFISNRKSVKSHSQMKDLNKTILSMIIIVVTNQLLNRKNKEKISLISLSKQQFNI
jgi:hypothetical protein